MSAERFYVASCRGYVINPATWRTRYGTPESESFSILGRRHCYRIVAEFNNPHITRTRRRAKAEKRCAELNTEFT